MSKPSNHPDTMSRCYLICLLSDSSYKTHIFITLNTKFSFGSMLQGKISKLFRKVFECDAKEGRDIISSDFN